jgi:outer membrane protein OmpA-like peptidoglycan-associated protein
MSDQDDNTQGFVIAVVLGVVAAVVAGVISLAVSSLHRQRTVAAPAGVAAPAIEPAPGAATARSTERVYFAVGSAALPAQTAEVIDRVARAARANAWGKVVISGFHDASGDPARNAEKWRRETEHGWKWRGCSDGRG